MVTALRNPMAIVLLQCHQSRNHHHHKIYMFFSSSGVIEDNMESVWMRNESRRTSESRAGSGLLCLSRRIILMKERSLLMRTVFGGFVCQPRMTLTLNWIF